MLLLRKITCLDANSVENDTHVVLFLVFMVPSLVCLVALTQRASHPIRATSFLFGPTHQMQTDVRDSVIRLIIIS